MKTDDPRFKAFSSDPKFRRIFKEQKKVEIDDRFRGMFHDKNFKVKYSIDKRGRPADFTSSEDLQRFYNLEDVDEDSSEEESKTCGVSEGKTKIGVCSKKKKKPSLKQKDILQDIDDIDRTDSSKQRLSLAKKKPKETLQEDEADTVGELFDPAVDFARGENVLDSDSSSGDESSDAGSDDEIDHGWGEMDRDAPPTETATSRLAMCNMDWDRVKATDIMVLLNSFLPPGGVVLDIAIYPSEFGLARMAEEEISGPKELTEIKLPSDVEEEDESEENEEGYHQEKLRQYQLSRMRYYYAVVRCDSAETAGHLYDEMDGMEYESTATKFDLRFIPDDVEFDEDPKDFCDKIPQDGKYVPKYFITSALQQSHVTLTWDQTDQDREQLFNAINRNQKFEDDDIQVYLASGSESEAEDTHIEEPERDFTDDKKSSVDQYRSILLDLEEKEQQKKSNDVEMEIKFEPGLRAKTEELVKKKQSDISITPFEEFVQKKKDKTKQKKKERKIKAEKEQDPSGSEEEEELPDDIINDPFFKEELQKERKSKTKSKKSDVNKEEDKQKEAQLKLLIMEEEDSSRKHFNLKEILQSEQKGKKKRKWKKEKKVESKEEDTFEVDVGDPRFSALYTSANYNIDPASPHFKKSKAMEKLISAKHERRREERQESQPLSAQKRQHAEVSLLAKSIKSKMQAFSSKQRRVTGC